VVIANRAPFLLGYEVMEFNYHHSNLLSDRKTCNKDLVSTFSKTNDKKNIMVEAKELFYYGKFNEKQVFVYGYPYIRVSL
jgi:hypothetical protein